MYMYHTAKMDLPGYFRAELSQFVLGMRRTIAQDIQNKDEQCEVEKSPLYLPIYRLMCEILYSSSNPDHVFDRAFLTMEFSLMDRAENCV